MYKQLQQRGMDSPPVNVSMLRDMKLAREPIACLTAYDASFAELVDLAGTDIVLVGDSLGMVIQGLDTTVPVTVADMVYHCRCVARGVRRAFLMADMPFMSYTTPPQALDNAVRLMQEGGAMMVKLEVGEGQVGIVEHLAKQDIPVCAHLGLKPQSVHKLGGFKVQGREEQAAQRMLDEARALEGAGADAVLLECVPNAVGAAIRDAVQVPVIGIGAGPGVDGQILVLYDVLGITQGRHAAVREEFSKRTRRAARRAPRVRSCGQRAHLPGRGALLLVVSPLLDLNARLTRGVDVGSKERRAHGASGERGPRGRGRMARRRAARSVRSDDGQSPRGALESRQARGRRRAARRDECLREPRAVRAARGLRGVSAHVGRRHCADRSHGCRRLVVRAGRR
jgi:3-methyl-2-oxobutanoate hydroxymethyltransferase